jgi:hypothetical protein
MRKVTLDLRNAITLIESFFGQCFDAGNHAAGAGPATIGV